MDRCQPGHQHTICVRWGECDPQGVVFNAHYLAYLDDALETWLRPLRATPEARNWDVMLVRCNLEWYASLRSGDRLDMQVAIARWGRTSFDMGFTGSCQGRPVFGALVVYVSVEKESGRSVETPAPIREFLGPAVDLIGPHRP